MKNRAVFLDRDGTLIEEKEYLHKPEDVVIYPGVTEALKKLRDAGFILFLVTNQSGVGRGFFTLEDVEKVHAHLANQLARHDVKFEKIYVAPEHPDAPSRGRKPSPQFLLDARDEFAIDLSKSYMMGDKLSDLECGWNAGVKKTILVRTGYGADLERNFPDKIKKAICCDEVASAAEWILRNSGADFGER